MVNIHQIAIVCTFLISDLYVASKDNITSLHAGTDTLARNYPAIVYNCAIAFPTGFRWNRTGPTGGYWQENSIDDYTFRPFFENIEEYNLLIYNRSGMLVYKTNDIYKGWDGYLANGNLAEQGVYIWKVSGTFFNGKSFSKTGDVTFIY